MAKKPDAAKPEAPDGKAEPLEGTPPRKRRRRIDLSTARDVRREMVAVYRKIDAGEIESQDGSRRVYVLRQIADVMLIEALEKRVDELTALMDSGRHDRGGNDWLGGSSPTAPLLQ